MAKVYDEWINKITKLREEMGQYDRVAATLRRQEKVEEDKILEELRYIKSRINTSSQILTDKQKTAFFFVLAPEEMIILDTRKAAELFARFDVPISGYVVNRVLPQELRRDNIPTYLKNRIQLQEKYLGEIRNSLGGQILAYVPEMERDVTGLPMIERLAGQLFENSRWRKSAPPSVGTSRRTQNANTFFAVERVERKSLTSGRRGAIAPRATSTTSGH